MTSLYQQNDIFMPILDRFGLLCVLDLLCILSLLGQRLKLPTPTPDPYPVVVREVFFCFFFWVFFSPFLKIGVSYFGVLLM